MEIIVFVLACMLSGIVAGTFGLGGGVVLMPMFVFVLPFFGIDENLFNIAVATSLACVFFTAISSSRSHFKRGGVDLNILKFWGPVNLVGCTLGAFWMASVDRDVIEPIVRTIYGVVMITLCVYKYFNYSKALFKTSSYNKFGLAFPLAFGWISSNIGIGGGNNVIGLSLFGVNVKKAIGTAAVLGLVVSLPSVAIYIYEGINSGVGGSYSFGFVNWLVVLFTIPITTLMAPVGVKIAYKISDKVLTKLWCLLSLGLALYMLSGLF